MKVLIMLLMLAVTIPAYAAEQPATNNATDTKQDSVEKKEDANVDKQPEKQDEKENELSCKYYKVTLPDDWKAIIKPQEIQGTINAIFAKNTGSPVITIIVGPRGGADAKMIAETFADQFKAEKDPVEKNGQYTFSFKQNNPSSQKDETTRAFVNVSGDEFMITTFTGNQKEALKFIKDNINSENYASLLSK